MHIYICLLYDNKLFDVYTWCFFQIGRNDLFKQGRKGLMKLMREILITSQVFRGKKCLDFCLEKQQRSDVFILLLKKWVSRHHGGSIEGPPETP